MAIITEIIGFTGATVGTFLMLPQVIKSIKTEKMDDVSSVMLWMYFLNCLLWLTYGILILKWPVIIGNSLALIISIVQLILKLK